MLILPFNMIPLPLKDQKICPMSLLKVILPNSIAISRKRIPKAWLEGLKTASLKIEVPLNVELECRFFLLWEKVVLEEQIKFYKEYFRYKKRNSKIN